MVGMDEAFEDALALVCGQEVEVVTRAVFERTTPRGGPCCPKRG